MSQDLLTLEQRLQFFFAPPLPMQTGSPQSTLHLLRRELQDCLIGDLMPEDEVRRDPRRHRLFATTMVLMSGADLLAKLLAGSDVVAASGARLKTFIAEYMLAGSPKAAAYAEVLYLGCRNPVLHSFSLHNTRYVMALVCGYPKGVVWRVREADTFFEVDVVGLYEAFIAAVGRYEAAVRADSTLQRNFMAMFPNYGGIDVHTRHIERVSTS